VRKIGLFLAVAVLILDQLTKAWALDALSARGTVIEVMPFWNFVLVWNYGISFGLFGGGAVSPLVLAAVTGAISLAVAVWLARAKSWYTAVAAGLILGGAIGNIIDRLVYGAVVDFIDWHVSGYHWPVFNIADAAITLGVVVLIAESLFGSKQANRRNAAEEK
jgi:signal peptidase II